MTGTENGGRSLSVRWLNQAREGKLGASVYLGKDDQVRLPSLNAAAVEVSLPITWCAFDVVNCPRVVRIDLEWHGSGPLFYCPVSDFVRQS